MTRGILAGSFCGQESVCCIMHRLTSDGPCQPITDAITTTRLGGGTVIGGIQRGERGETFDVVLYCLVGAFKILFLMFNLVPYIALLIVE